MASWRWTPWSQPLLESKQSTGRYNPHTSVGIIDSEASMENTKLQLDAEIIPNHGLGNLKLRLSICDLVELVTGLGVYKSGSFYLASPFEARYRLGEGQVEIAVDVRNGKVFKLIAYAGYKGKLFNKITVGMQVHQAMKLEPRLFYDEAEEVILCRGVQGLTIDIPEIDPPPNLVPEMEIKAISVFAEEINTLQGMKGHW